MWGRRITLFKLLGFEVRLDASWLILAALVAWSLALGLFPYQYRGLRLSTYWAMGIAGTVGLFISIVLHELSHSLVARRYALPMRGITLFIFGGVAEMDREPPSARAEFMMAIAGPLSSIVLGFIFFGIERAGRLSWPAGVVGVLAYLAWINWILAAFNLIPAFPLDGGRVLRSILWWRWNGELLRATRIASRIGQGFGILLMAAGFWQLLVGNFINAVWWFLLGIFLRDASGTSYRQVVLQTTLSGEPVRRFMHTNPVTVSPDLPLDQLVEDYLYRYHHKMFPVVTGEEHLEGYVTTRDVTAVPRDQWPRRRVREVLHPPSPENTVTPDADAMAVLSHMKRSGLSRLLVADRDRLLAVVSLQDLLHFLSAKMELEHRPAA